MKYLSLVLKSARRSKRRTALTVLSVALAVFLFASLRAVLDGFNAGAEASSSTRIVTQRSTSLFFAMPISHGEAIKATPGVQDVTWANWFGGVYKDPQNFFAQYAIEPESYLRMYPEIVLTPEEKRGVPRRPHWLHRRGRTGPELRVQDRRQDHAAGRHPDVWDEGFRLHRPRHLQVGRRGGRQPVDVLSLEIRRRAVRREGACRVVYRADFQPGSGAAVRRLIRVGNLRDTPPAEPLLDGPLVGVFPMKEHRQVVHRRAARLVDAADGEVESLVPYVGMPTCSVNPVARSKPVVRPVLPRRCSQCGRRGTRAFLWKRAGFPDTCGKPSPARWRTARRNSAILVDAAEPVRPGDVLHTGGALDRLAVADRHGKKERRRTLGHDARRRAGLGAPALKPSSTARSDANRNTASATLRTVRPSGACCGARS